MLTKITISIDTTLMPNFLRAHTEIACAACHRVSSGRQK